MDIEWRQSGSVLMAVIDGEIDSSNAHMLREKLVGSLLKGNLQMLLDLGAVSFVSSAGLSAIVAVFMTAQREGGTLKLCNLQPNVLRSFRLTRLDRSITLFDSAAEALESF